MQCCPKSIKKHCPGCFPKQCCLESLSQNCIEFCHVQCSPKSIKTILNRMFYYAMLSGASVTTLHRVFPVQCCPKSIKATLLNMTFSCALLSEASRTTLHRVFSTCVVLFGTSWTALHRGLSLRLQTTLHEKEACSVLP